MDRNERMTLQSDVLCIQGNSVFVKLLVSVFHVPGSFPQVMQDQVKSQNFAANKILFIGAKHCIFFNKGKQDGTIP